MREAGPQESVGLPAGSNSRESGVENIPGRARVTVGTDAKDDARTEAGPDREAARGNADELSEDERRAVDELKRRDREVRAHEQAHMAAAGGHALGGPSYSFQTGPDGHRYAIGGEVKIDTSPVRDDPRATIAKAQTVRAAALAPADPSGADRAVAAAAAKMESEAQRALSQPEEAKQGAEKAGGSARERKDSRPRMGGRDAAPQQIDTYA